MSIIILCYIVQYIPRYISYLLYVNTLLSEFEFSSVSLLDDKLAGAMFSSVIHIYVFIIKLHFPYLSVLIILDGVDLLVGESAEQSRQHSILMSKG